MYVLLNEMTKQLLNLNIIQKDGRTENINRSIRSIVWAKFRKSVQKLVVPKNLQTRFLVGEKKSQALDNCRSGSGGAELIVVVHFLVFSFLGLVFSASPITLLCQLPALILIMVVYSDWFERFFSVEEI